MFSNKPGAIPVKPTKVVGHTCSHFLPGQRENLLKHTKTFFFFFPDLKKFKDYAGSIFQQFINTKSIYVTIPTIPWILDMNSK